MEDIAQPIDHQPASPDQVFAVAWEQVFQCRPSGFQEQVNVASLWHTPSGGGIFRKWILIEDRYPFETVGEYSRCAQTGYTRSNHDRMFPDVRDSVVVVPWNSCERHGGALDE
jgi:hypothetical protein